MEGREAKGQKIKSEVYREHNMMEGESADELTKTNDNQFNVDKAKGEEKGYDVGEICPEYETSSDEIRSEENSQIIISQIVEYIVEGVCGDGTKVLNDENIMQEEGLGQAADKKEIHKTVTRDTTGGEHENHMTNMEKSLVGQRLSKDTVESQNINDGLIREDDESFESERDSGKCCLVPKKTHDSPLLHKGTDRDESHGTAGEIGKSGSNIFGQVIFESSTSKETACVHTSNETIPENDMESKGFNNGVTEDQNRRADDKSIYVDEPKKTTNDSLNQDSSNSEDRLSKVLNILNLTDKYPGGFTCSYMYKITKSSLFDEQPKCHKDLANYFLQKIAKYNYTAREFHITEGHEHSSSSVETGKKSKFRQKMEKGVEENNVMKVSPMDVIIAVFLCCDDICKQDLVSHMWSCRLAVPLIIQEKVLPSQPSCYLWPLRSLVMRWETEVNEKHFVREGRLVKEAVTSIAFIRFGEVGLSKSALINSVISASEKTHSIFMNRDSPGSTKYRHLVDGMIDIGWYFPTPKTEAKHHDCFQDAVMFLNLHGDAYELQSQLELLSKLASTITVLCKVKDFHRCRHILKSYVNGGNTLLIMLADQKIHTEDEDVIEDVMNYLEANDNQLEFVAVLDKRKADLIKETRSKLRDLSEGKCVRLEDILSLNVRVSIDEKTKDQQESKKQALVLSNKVRTTPYEDRKNIHLPLQGNPWIEWAKADKDRLRTTNKRRNENIDSYMADRMKTMKICRSQQRQILKRGANNTLLQLFLESINTDNHRKRKLFLRWLKYELDDLSREELRPVYRRYQEIMKNLAKVKEQDTQKIELDKLDKEVALLSFGLEHILREMGQAYEALRSKKMSPTPLFEYNLPDLAAKILLDGYPFELLDGHVNSVPLCWVEDVLNAVEHFLKHKLNVQEVRTKTISALGIQSSGKSTMLNALFGCQYAVSAGRCTRGAYCQFIEVDEQCREVLGTDLILAIDTEGLRAPELSAGDQMVRHDNELSTFVIGLADITILNLMGENTTYLDELLPISVHAFLRMEMATNFKPKCVIIHQNVNREDDEKLLNQGRILEEKLNKMTQLASNVERVETKSFNDIIDFDVGRDVFYVSALLEGIQPMAPISTRYSEELNAFKRALVKKDDKKVQTSLASFVSNLDKLWSNIKKDDFVYQFRNTIETEARRKLDDYWCHANCSFRQPVKEMVETGYVTLQYCTDINELQDLVKSLESDFKGEINKEYQNQTCAFKRFLKEADPLMKETMMRWSTDMEARFDDLRSNIVRETLAKLQEFEQDKKRTFSLKQDMVGYQNKLKAEIEELVSVLKSAKDKPVSENDISSHFERHWKDWTSQIIKRNPRYEAPITIEDDAFEAILRSFPSESHFLTKLLKRKHIDRYDTRDFDVKEIISWKSRFVSFLGLSNYTKQIEDLAKDVFDLVDTKLEKRRLNVRPYTPVDIDELVISVRKHLESKRDTTKTTTQIDVYLVVLVCGCAIKKLRKFHEEYVSQNNLEKALENQKEHYFSTFKSLYDETETLNLLVNNFNEILKRGMLEKMTRTFPEIVVISMENNSFIKKEKSWAMLALLEDIATNGSFDDFDTFIRRPEKSISCYISKLVEKYFNQEVNPLQSIFKAILGDIKAKVNLILQNTFESVRNFQTWLKTLQKNAEKVIVLENIDGLNDLCKKDIDLKLFNEKVNAGLQGIVGEISSDMQSFLRKKRKLFSKQVVEQVLMNIVGCTNSCPFCGAVCMVAYAGHSSDHYTTLHRPQGCKRWHNRDTKVLVTRTCPMSVASKNLEFRYMDKDEEKYCLYKEYKRIYEHWGISADETGEETSFWNWFFAKHAKEIAGDDLVVPEIPLSWKELDRETEIDKLRTRLKNSWGP